RSGSSGLYSLHSPYAGIFRVLVVTVGAGLIDDRALAGADDEPLVRSQGAGPGQPLTRGRDGQEVPARAGDLPDRVRIRVARVVELDLTDRLRRRDLHLGQAGEERLTLRPADVPDLRLRRGPERVGGAEGDDGLELAETDRVRAVGVLATTGPVHVGRPARAVVVEQSQGAATGQREGQPVDKLLEVPAIPSQDLQRDVDVPREDSTPAVGGTVARTFEPLDGDGGQAEARHPRLGLVAQALVLDLVQVECVGAARQEEFRHLPDHHPNRARLAAANRSSSEPSELPGAA